MLTAFFIRSYCVEASLDVEYITAVSGSVPTSVFNDLHIHGDFLDWILNVTSFRNPPLGM